MFYIFTGFKNVHYDMLGLLLLIYMIDVSLLAVYL